MTDDPELVAMRIRVAELDDFARDTQAMARELRRLAPWRFVARRRLRQVIEARNAYVRDESAIVAAVARSHLTGVTSRPC